MYIEKKFFQELKKRYNEKDQQSILKAYQFASQVHQGQKRKSGEDYIIHPMYVAFFLMTLNADVDTIRTGLLHDVIEDTNVSKQFLSILFNWDVANLVDGVSELKKMNFSSVHDFEQANKRKFIEYFLKDPREIIIKFEDRLHNMMTIQFLKEEKQQAKSIENFEFYIPFCYLMGAYELKNILEDLSLKYLKPLQFQSIQKKQREIKENRKFEIIAALELLKKKLNEAGIANDLRITEKNIYGIYNHLEQGEDLFDIHNLFAIRVLVDTIEDCKKAEIIIEENFHTLTAYNKDYLEHPKTNQYQAYHMTVRLPSQLSLEFQIRTKRMEIISSQGITGYWHLYPREKAADKMKEALKTKYDFYSLLAEMNQNIADNEEFLTQVHKEILGRHVYVKDRSGNLLELPAGATAVDFAYKIHTDIGNHMVKAFVNHQEVPFNYILKNEDQVEIITDVIASAPPIETATTYYSRKRINRFYKGLNG